MECKTIKEVNQTKPLFLDTSLTSSTSSSTSSKHITTSNNKFTNIIEERLQVGRTTIDKRKDNHGAPVRRSYTNTKKALFVEMIEQRIDMGMGRNAKEVLRLMNFSEKEVTFQAANYYKWQKGNVIDINLQMMGEKRGDFPFSSPPFTKWK